MRRGTPRPCGDAAGGPGSPWFSHEKRTEEATTMRRDLMDVLACPVCKGTLELQVDHEDGQEIISGRLICHACNETYPIEEAIPNLLPPQFRG